MPSYQILYGQFGVGWSRLISQTISKLRERHHHELFWAASILMHFWRKSIYCWFGGKNCLQSKSVIVWYRLTTFDAWNNSLAFFPRENGKSHMEFLCMKFTFLHRQQVFKRALPVIFHPERNIIDGKLFFVRGALGLIRMSSRVPHVGSGGFLWVVSTH